MIERAMIGVLMMMIFDIIVPVYSFIFELEFVFVFVFSPLPSQNFLMFLPPPTCWSNVGNNVMLKKRNMFRSVGFLFHCTCDEI